MALSGCVVTTGGGGGGGLVAQPGDVQFDWSFLGGTCSDYPEIRTVHITIPGQRLMNNGEYSCLVNNYPGIILANFAGGRYDYSIEAIGYGGESLFVQSGSFVVDGSIVVRVDLSPTNGGNSYAYLRWFFPPNSTSNNPSCDQAGVSQVLISIDNGQWYTRTCAEGQTATGSATPFLAPGQHSIVISATDSTNYEYYRFSGTFVTTGGGANAQDFSLQWSVGTAVVGAAFSSGGVQQTCASLGVSEVLVNFQDAQGNNLFGNDWDRVNCAMAQQGVSYYLAPGVYRVFMTAQGPGGTYNSNMNNPPSVQVNAGQFPTSPLVLTLQR